MQKYPEIEPKIRFSRIQQMMEERGLDAMIFYSTQWKLEIIHYVANLRLLGEDACVVLPKGGEPILLLSQPWDLERARAQSWIQEIEVCPGTALLERAGKLARSMGEHIGVAGIEFMTAAKYADLQRELSGKTVTNEYSGLDEVAKVKTDWEVELMRESARLADAAYLAELNALRVGMSEYELVAELEYAMKREGADENFQNIGVGVGLPSMNRARENYVKMGDLILAEITPVVGCITYAVQLCRTAKMGEATELEREKYGLLCEALEHAMTKIKGGIKAKDIAIWQNDIIGAAGYEKYCHPPFMRSRGHNFGLGYIDLSETNEEILRPNTVLVVHPNQKIPEIGYLVCGETVLITETGVERLSKIPPKLHEVQPMQ